MLAQYVCAVTNNQPRAGQLRGGKCYDACFSLGICSVKRQTYTSQSNVQGQVCEAYMPHDVSEGSSLCLCRCKRRLQPLPLPLQAKAPAFGSAVVSEGSSFCISKDFWAMPAS